MLFKCINAHKYIRDFNDNDSKLNRGKSLAVIYGGNTAMDSVHAAKRTNGVSDEYLVYRRNILNAPADEDEINLVIEEGVNIKEFYAP